jgi:glutamate-1-semialdehyde 2,1-aminomutase
MNREASHALFARNRQWIPGGTVSLNRKVDPAIAFVRGKGAHLWDADGNRYVDYHAAFGPYLLGHNHPRVEEAVCQAQTDGWTLTGTGTTPWEGRGAELFLSCVTTADRVQFTNTGSEATALAVRLARAVTGRTDLVLMQGGYNGWQDDVACNVMTPLEHVGPQRTDGEYPWRPLSAGIPETVGAQTHVIEFNSVEAIEWALSTHRPAAVLMEPILQNIGVVKPRPGYLAAVRALCDRHGAVLIFDEVKTGFRHALGGYQSVEGVRPDLSTFGKAIANGYPLGAVAGRSEIMDRFDDPDPARRVLIAGTYNGHPIPVAAAIATMELLREHDGAVYEELEAKTAGLTEAITEVFCRHGRPVTVARQASAFCLYFMERAPESWHDLAAHHDMAADTSLRKALIDRGIYVFPLPTKQWSVSAAHAPEDFDATLDALEFVLPRLNP